MDRSEDVRVTLRIPVELYRKLTESAEASTPRTSLNSEIISRLAGSFRDGTSWEMERHAHEAELEELKQRQEALEKRLDGMFERLKTSLKAKK